MNKLELEDKIGILEDKISIFEIDTQDYVEQYEYYLDDVCEEVTVAGIIFTPSYVLKNLDSVAFRCGLIDYVNSIELIDDPSYQELLTELETLKDALETLEEEEVE